MSAHHWRYLHTDISAGKNMFMPHQGRREGLSLLLSAVYGLSLLGKSTRPSPGA
jgi:hypothetical protein